MSKCECCKEENSDLITYKGYKMCPACYMGYVRKVKVCENNAKYETEIDQLKQQLESREDSDSSTMKYLNKLRDENIKLKKELSRYKSYKTDDERIKDLTNLYSQYKEENNQLKKELKDKDFALECKERDIKAIERQGDKAYDDYGYLDKISRELALQNYDYEKQIALLKSSEKCLTERIKNQTQLAIQELEKVKVNLKDRISMMKNKEHSYLQKFVAWRDICDQINQQIKELED